MVGNFAAGGAAINQLCDVFGASLSVHSLDLDRPTNDFSTGPAMKQDECLAALTTGWESVDPSVDLLVTGEMGIGNTTSAAAIALALFGGKAEGWVGRGTGLDDKGLRHKAEVVQKAVAINQPETPLEVLQMLGGRELAAMAGDPARTSRAYSGATRRVHLLCGSSGIASDRQYRAGPLQSRACLGGSCAWAVAGKAGARPDPVFGDAAGRSLGRGAGDRHLEGCYCLSFRDGDFCTGWCSGKVGVECRWIQMCKKIKGIENDASGYFQGKRCRCHRRGSWYRAGGGQVFCRTGHAGLPS